MSRKPTLNVIEPGASSPQPPRPLGPHGRSLWQRVMAEYAIADTGGVELLTLAAQALDRAEALSERIAQDGEVTYTKGGPKAHPAIRDETACRAFVVRTLQKLGLNVEAIKPVGRPSGGVGITWDKLTRDRDE
jgi:hypothetical protein